MKAWSHWKPSCKATSSATTDLAEPSAPSSTDFPTLNAVASITEPHSQLDELLSFADYREREREREREIIVLTA
jgi:hypothetical protein